MEIIPVEIFSSNKSVNAKLQDYNTYKSCWVIQMNTFLALKCDFDNQKYNLPSIRDAAGGRGGGAC